MLGIPCLVASQDDLEWLQKAIGRAPREAVTVDVDKQEVRFGDRVIKATIPDGPRNQLVGGTWDSTAVLLEAGAAHEGAAGEVPHLEGGGNPQRGATPEDREGDGVWGRLPRARPRAPLGPRPPGLRPP